MASEVDNVGRISHFLPHPSCKELRERWEKCMINFLVLTWDPSSPNLWYTLFRVKGSFVVLEIRGPVKI